MIWSRMTAVAAIGLSVAIFHGHALADTVWSFSTGGTNSGNVFGNTRTYTGVVATAWSDTLNPPTGAYVSTTAQIQTAYLGTYGGSGLGVTNQDGVVATTGCTSAQDCGEGIIGNTTPPEHAVDNNGRYDSILLDFGLGNRVALTGIGIGYPTSTTYDSDISLLACDTSNGCNPTLPVLDGKTYSSLRVANGWTLVGSYADLTVASALPGSTTPDVRKVNGGNPTNLGVDKTSSGLDSTNNPGTGARYWLVTAFNPTLSGAITGFDAGNDYFKLLSVYGTPVKTPEPGSLALLGILAAGAVSVKRFKKKAQPTLS